MSDEYPGLTGVPTAHRDWNRWALSGDERAELMRAIDLELAHDHPSVENVERYVDDLEYVAQIFRGWHQIATESRLPNRIANIKAYIGWLEREKPGWGSLSQINIMAINQLMSRENPPRSSRLKVARQVLAHLVGRKRRPGRPPSDEIMMLIDGVADVYGRFTGEQPRTTKDGRFSAV